MKKVRTDPSYLKYIKYRNLYNTLKRTAKIKYYTEVFHKYKFDIRNTWKTIRTLIGGENDKTTVTQTFMSNNNVIWEPKEIASNFCNFFSTIGQQYADKIPQPVKPYDHCLTKNKARNNKTFFYEAN
jgi:hypothetical protein